MVMDLAKPDKTSPDQAAFDWISFLTGFVFVADVAGRLYAYGFERYFSDPWEVADFSIVCLTFSVSVATLALDADPENNNASWVKAVTFLRVLRIVRFVRIVSSGTGAARQQVGQNKRRYQKDGFDLDLTYITDQCIGQAHKNSATVLVTVLVTMLVLSPKSVTNMNSVIESLL